MHSAFSYSFLCVRFRVSPFCVFSVACLPADSVLLLSVPLPPSPCLQFSCFPAEPQLLLSRLPEGTGCSHSAVASQRVFPGSVTMQHSDSTCKLCGKGLCCRLSLLREPGEGCGNLVACCSAYLVSPQLHRMASGKTKCKCGLF